MPRKFKSGTMPQRVRVPSPGVERPPQDVTIVLASFLRPAHLWQVLMSCRREFPGVPVIVADCSLKEGQALPPAFQRCRDLPGVTWLQLPFDAGVSACRNAAVEAARTELVFLTDDDHVFCWASDLQGLCEVLHESRADIASGCLQNDLRVQSWSYLIAGDPPRHRTTPVRSSDEWQRTSGGHAWRKTGTFFNAFVAKRETLLAAPWDKQFPIMEHRDHICTVHERGLSVVYSPAMIVLHDRTTATSEAYHGFRWRREQMDQRLAAKRGSVVSFGPALDEPIPAVLPVDQSPLPNLLVFGVGHSGTTIVTRILAKIPGYSLGDADAEYAESVSIREANQEWLAQRHDRQLPGCAAKRLAKLPSPWVLKDPRFVHTLEAWLPLLAPHDPLLLFLTREVGKLLESYERRGERPTRDGLDLSQITALAERQYERWPWRKLRIDAAQVEALMALWQPGRI